MTVYITMTNGDSCPHVFSKIFNPTRSFWAEQYSQERRLLSFQLRLAARFRGECSFFGADGWDSFLRKLLVLCPACIRIQGGPHSDAFYPQPRAAAPAQTLSKSSADGASSL